MDGISVWVRVATGVLGALALLSAAIRGAGAVSGERDRDTWVSLVSTPLSAWELLAGKWWGCVFGPRRIYAMLLVVWAMGLTVGAVQPVMIPLTAAAAALCVYVSAFAWLGLYCSITARKTMTATVRTIMAGAFLGGGYMIAFVLFCVVPLELLSSRSTGVQGIVENVAQLLLGAMPPFVLGWLPLDEFNRSSAGPFCWSQYDHDPVFGPVAPAIGLFAWAAFGAFMAVLSWLRFLRLTNRRQEPLWLSGPPAYAGRSSESTDARNPSA